MTPSAMILMRSRLPPENVLKMSRTPPEAAWLYSVDSATGSTPGSGTNDRKRKTISAPIVNQMRFLSSVALPNFEKFRLEAS